MLTKGWFDPSQGLRGARVVQRAPYTPSGPEPRKGEGAPLELAYPYAVLAPSPSLPGRKCYGSTLVLHTRGLGSTPSRPTAP